MEAAAGSARQPVPEAAALSAAEARLDEDFKVSESGDRDLAVAFARRLIEQAAALDDDPPLRYAMFRRAVLMAATAREPELALSAVDEWAEYFAVDPLKFKIAALQVTFKSSAGDGEKSLEIIYKLLEEAAAVERYDEALELAQLAARLSKNDVKLRTTARQRHSDLREAQANHAAVKDSIAGLKKSPDDPKLNLIVGRYRAFTQQDPRRGIPMLALGSDLEMAAAALLEMKSPVEPSAMKQLGDRWWEIGETQTAPLKQQMQNHASEWYQKALPGLVGLDRLAVEKRLPPEKTAVPSPLVELESLVGKPVRIVNQGSGLSLGTTHEEGIDVVRQRRFASGNKRFHWELQPLGDGLYKIVNKANENVLVVYKGYAESGTQVICWPFDPHATDHYWNLQQSADGTFRIINRRSKHVLAPEERSTKAEAIVRQQAALEDHPPDQRWQITPLGK